MSKQQFTLLFLLIFSVFVAPVHGVQVGKLYVGVVPIESQEDGLRANGFDEALNQVLMKVTGKAELTNDAQSTLLSVFRPSEAYVQTFSYRENPEYLAYMEAEAAKLALKEQMTQESIATEELPAADEIVEESLDEELAPLPYLLEVSFSESAVNSKLTEKSIPVWGKTRPNVLLWIVTESAGERLLLGDGLFEQQAYLEKLASQKGLPVFLPVADLEDASAMDLSDVWALFPGAVEQASQRYRADATVMLRLYPTVDDTWAANWSIQHRSIIESGEFSDKSIDIVIEKLTNHIAAMLSSRYAVIRTQNENSSDFKIVISDITNFEDYILVQRYLENLPPVAEVHLDWVKRTSHGYRLKLSGSEDQFFEHIDLGRKLARDKLMPESHFDLNLEDELDFDKLIELQESEPDARLIWSGSR